jgi:hypothetical protein
MRKAEYDGTATFMFYVWDLRIYYYALLQHLSSMRSRQEVCKFIGIPLTKAHKDSSD